MTRGKYAPKKYRLYDLETGELVTSGTSTEIGNAIGVGKGAISNAVNSGQDTYKRYLIEKIPSELVAGDDAEAIRKWDEFCEPLRKEFGIPVYREKKGKRNGQ